MCWTVLDATLLVPAFSLDVFFASITSENEPEVVSWTQF